MANAESGGLGRCRRWDYHVGKESYELPWRNQEGKETPLHKERDVLTSEGGTRGLSDLR